MLQSKLAQSYGIGSCGCPIGQAPTQGPHGVDTFSALKAWVYPSLFSLLPLLDFYNVIHHRILHF